MTLKNCKQDESKIHNICILITFKTTNRQIFSRLLKNFTFNFNSTVYLKRYMGYMFFKLQNICINNLS